MEIALIIAIVTVIWILWYIVHTLLWTLKELAKLLKADNLQEYTQTLNDEEEDNIDVWQEKRYSEIWSLTDEQLRSIEIKPNNLYDWSVWDNAKTETFN